MNNPAQTTNTIIQFIAQTFALAHKTTAVIGLSGGIDSATSLILTAKALGPKHVYAFYLPTKKSNPIHQVDAQAAVMAAGLPETNFQSLPIGSIIQKSWRVIQKSQANQIPNENNTNQLRLANLTARIRMLILFDEAKKRDALVIGTENLSEQMLGYFTRFGDAASDIEPLTHLFKTQVMEIAQYLGVPASILTKKPTADLWPGQTDAAELGFTYEEADPILACIREGKTKAEIIGAQFPEPLVSKIFIQVEKAAFKQLVPYHL